MAGVAIDGVDTVAAVGEVRAGKLSNLGKIASGCGAALFAGLGVVCLAMEEDS